MMNNINISTMFHKLEESCEEHAKNLLEMSITTADHYSITLFLLELFRTSGILE